MKLLWAHETKTTPTPTVWFRFVITYYGKSVD